MSSAKYMINLFQFVHDVMLSLNQIEATSQFRKTVVISSLSSVMAKYIDNREYRATMAEENLIGC